MIRVAVEHLEPGMVLAAPIPHPHQPGVALLQADYSLDSRSIRRLPKYGIKGAWIRHPGFDFLDQRLSAAIPESRARLYHHIKANFAAVAERTADAFDLDFYKDVVGQLITELVIRKDHAVWAERILEEPEELFSHSANVTYLALILGMSLKNYIIRERKYVPAALAKDLTNLGIGAMLHDIGKIHVSPELRRLHVLDPIENAEGYRSHPVRGYEMLGGRINATAVGIVLHHHQRFDGGGFPAPRRQHVERRPDPILGHRIHIFPRIVAVANVLDGMLSMCDRQGLPKVAALAALQAPEIRTMFDPVIFAAAVRCIPPFAIGTCVTLSDGRQAVVVNLNPRRPCEPVVRILKPGATQADAAGKEVNLTRRGAPTIACENGRPVGQYLYTPPQHITRHLAASYQQELEKDTISDLRAPGSAVAALALG